MARGLKTETGTEVVTQNGYVNVKTEDGWKYKHVIIMEKKLGRLLGENERVHFKDGNKKNIKISNLELHVVTKQVPTLDTINKVRKRVDKIEEQFMEEVHNIRDALYDLETQISR